MKRATISKLSALAILMVGLGACGGDAEEPPAGDAAMMDADSGVMAAPAAAPAGGFLDPNVATVDQLQRDVALSAEAAEALAAGRPYADMRGVDQVLAQQNLTEEQRDSAYTRLWMPIDLNAASAEEIMLIPGVGERMQHEFEEYRPYTSIDQFRREIGKYVDEQEVARLERYVMIR